MTHSFDKNYWEQHWREGRSGSMRTSPAHPYLMREVNDIKPGTALEVGCGSGAEAIWLASHSWQVTGVDISAEVLEVARERALGSGVSGVQWVEADAAMWEPGRTFDLVTTHYAHSSIPQLQFYERIASWVAPSGNLLIVGHLHDHDADRHQGHGPVAEASVTVATVIARLDEAEWDIVTAEELERSLTTPNGREVVLNDVVVRATRRM